MAFYNNLPSVFVNHLSKSQKIKDFIKENNFNLPGFIKDLHVIQTFFKAFVGAEASGKILKPAMSDFKVLRTVNVITKAVITNRVETIFPGIRYDTIWYNIPEVRNYIKSRANKALRLASTKANGKFVYNVGSFLPHNRQKSPFFCSYFSYDSGILYDFINYKYSTDEVAKIDTAITMRIAPPSMEYMLELSTGYSTRVKITEADIKQFLVNNPDAFNDYVDLIEDEPFAVDNIFDVIGLNIPQSTYGAINNIKLPRNKELVIAIYEDLAACYDLFKVKPIIKFSSNGFILQRTGLKHSVTDIFKVFEETLNAYGVKNKNIGPAIHTFPGGVDIIGYQTDRRGIDFSWSSAFDPEDIPNSKVTIKFSFR